MKINGEMHYLWRAVDQEGEILESYVTKTRDKAAALRFMKKTLKRHGSPETITTDGLRSYKAAMTELGCEQKQEVGRWAKPNKTARQRLLNAWGFCLRLSATGSAFKCRLSGGRSPLADSQLSAQITPFAGDKWILSLVSWSSAN